jgi:hypothetical protein
LFVFVCCDSLQVGGNQGLVLISDRFTFRDLYSRHPTVRDVQLDARGFPGENARAVGLKLLACVAVVSGEGISDSADA